MNSFAEHDFKQYPEQTAAIKLAEAQHAPGVFCRMNPKTFRVEYVRPDGTIVPDYQHYLKQTLTEGEQSARNWEEKNRGKYDVVEHAHDGIYLWRACCDTKEEAEAEISFLKGVHPRKRFSIQQRT